MKKILLSLSAIATTLLTTPVYAQSDTSWTTSPQCLTILGLPAVSPYVRKVLARADAGLTFSASAPADPLFLLPPWVTRVGSAWAALIGDSMRLTIQADDLVHNTGCLRFDMAQIECKMDQVRSEMNNQLTRGSFGAILRLEKLLQFLNARYTQLAIGALDTGYQDPTWGIVEGFDPPQNIFCCAYAGDTCNQMPLSECDNVNGKSFVYANQCSTAGCKAPNDGYSVEDEMCPYSSDYEPPLLNGFGCDLDVMSSRTAFAPLQSEHNALQLITDKLNDYRTAAQLFLTVQQSIDSIFNTSTPLPPPPTPREHLTANGCKWTGGVCEDDPSIRCQKNDECDGNSCIFPTKICKNSRNLQCFDDGECLIQGQDLGPCVENDGKVASTAELRGPFSIKKNHLRLLIDFLALRLEEGYSREFPDQLKYGQELQEQSSVQSERYNEPYFNQFLRASSRILYASWSQIQGESEADAFVYGSDPALEVAHALSSLRKSVGDLARLATEKDKGLRSFVIKYAYFLRRSCVYRACNASLEEILKIAFADDCFPYTNGDYLNDDADNPRSEKCADDAEIALP